MVTPALMFLLFLIGGRRCVYQSSTDNYAVSNGAEDANSGSRFAGEIIQLPFSIFSYNMKNYAQSVSGTANAGSQIYIDYAAAPISASSTSFRNNATSFSGVAVSGNNFTVNTTTGDLVFIGKSERDAATVLSGPSVALSGNNVLVINATGDVVVNTTSLRSDASSDLTLSGSRVNVRDYGSSNITIYDESSRNNIVGSGVSGSRFAVYQADVPGSSVRSIIDVNQIAIRNDASGNEGSLLSGVSSQMDAVYIGKVDVNARSNLNKVTIGNDTNVAISGAQATQIVNAFSDGNHNLVSTNNEVVGSGKNTTNAVAGVQSNQGFMVSTTHNSSAVARDNVVDIDKGNAIAGVQNNLFRAYQAFGQGPSKINLSNMATNNVANTSNVAVAGVQNNFLVAATSVLDIDSVATDNKAYSVEGMAVGGVQNNMQLIVNSDATFTSKAQDNYAYSAAPDGMAVAGIQSNFQTVRDTTMQMNNQALYNIAVANNGTAIAGVQTNIDRVQGQSAVVIDNLVGANIAISNGNAIVQSQQNIGAGTNLVTNTTTIQP